MWEGTLIFFVGGVVGYFIANRIPKKQVQAAENTSRYSKYRNADGLLSYKAAKDKVM